MNQKEKYIKDLKDAGFEVELGIDSDIHVTPNIQSVPKDSLKELLDKLKSNIERLIKETIYLDDFPRFLLFKSSLAKSYNLIRDFERNISTETENSNIKKCLTCGETIDQRLTYFYCKEDPNLNYCFECGIKYSGGYKK